MRSFLLLAVFTSTAYAETGHWLNARDITYMLVGRDVSGLYQNGARFAETYRRVGKIEYQDESSKLQGTWTQKNDLFCTYYEGSPGGCYRIKLTSPNCFEYWLVDDAGATAPSWIAQASQTKYMSSCPAKSS
jgi:hypothetical protein